MREQGSVIEFDISFGPVSHALDIEHRRARHHSTFIEYARAKPIEYVVTTQCTQLENIWWSIHTN